MDESLQLRRPDMPDLVQIMPDDKFFKSEAIAHGKKEFFKPGHLRSPTEFYHLHATEALEAIHSVLVRKVAKFGIDHLAIGGREKDVESNENQEVPDNALNASIGPEEFEDQSHLLYFRTSFPFLDRALGGIDRALITADSHDLLLKVTRIAYRAGLRSQVAPIHLIGPLHIECARFCSR